MSAETINKGITKKIIKNKLFPNNNDVAIWDKVMIDDMSVSHITTPEDAIKITKIIKQHCHNLQLTPLNVSITDATAGVGGNVISFAQHFMSVNAVEIDVMRYKCLVNNIDAYKFTNVLSYCDDCLNVIFKFSQQDIVFFDPPWGGLNYKDKDNIKLTLSDTPIEDICTTLFDDNKTMSVPSLICLKLPKNYDIEYLYNRLADKLKLEIWRYDLKKMYIIIIQRSSKHINRSIINIGTTDYSS